MRGEFLAQRAAGLHEQRQVDRFVAHLQLRVIGSTMGTRDAGQFSLSFVWGTISGTYDTSQ